MIYPNGIPYFSAGGFGTALMGICYQELSLIQAEKQKEAAVAGASSEKIIPMVDHRVTNWNHIKRELVAWYKVLGQTSRPQTTSGY